MFDSAHLTCSGGGAGVKDTPSKKKKAPAEVEEEGESFYDAMKKEMGGRLARTRAALDALDDEQRLVMEGHRPGAYLRLSFTGDAQALLHIFSIRGNACPPTDVLR